MGAEVAVWIGVKRVVAERGRRVGLGVEVKVVEADLGRVGAVLLLVLLLASVSVLADLDLDLVLLDLNIVVGSLRDACCCVGGGWLGAVVRWFWAFSWRVRRDLRVVERILMGSYIRKRNSAVTSTW